MSLKTRGSVRIECSQIFLTLQKKAEAMNNPTGVSPLRENPEQATKSGQSAALSEFVAMQAT
jgi:hypothetical protein